MGTGLLVAVAILTVLPVVAVWASHHWRDPPREKWAIPQERRDAARNTPELVAYRRRIELGVGHGPRATAVNRAIARGTEAPPELRAATHELAQVRVRELDARLPRLRRAFAGWLVVTAVMVAVAVFAHVRLLGLYSVFWIGQAVTDSPYLARKRRDRAAAAVTANAPAV